VGEFPVSLALTRRDSVHNQYDECNLEQESCRLRYQVGRHLVRGKYQRERHDEAANE
jgi:hypothetical protein